MQYSYFRLAMKLMMMKSLFYSLISFAVVVMFASFCRSAENDRSLRVLFLGDNGHHRPRERFAQLAPVLKSRGIELEYTDNLADLNAEKLSQYDVLALYANIDRIEDDQANALLKFVEQGKGFVPIHCATYCFRNNPEIVALMGAQFQRHGTGVFHTDIAKSDHPIMRGFGGFTSWDETYVHHLHNEQNRTVLSYRVDAEGREPWTWVRTHGKGRVFYTAWGHDHRTWGNPGFQNLIERGIRWAAGQDLADVPAYRGERKFIPPQMQPPADDVKFEYVDVGAKIPNYPAGQRWGTQEKPLSLMQRPLPPELSMKLYSVPVGFRMSLYAAEPSFLGKPIAMNWDERGRLWVCETYDYPNELQPPGKGRDRIRICEDTDHDGVADKFTVFAEKLSIPTAITFYRGGAIVQNGMETIYLKDTDGDDVADVRKVLITGWALGDTHGGVSNFRFAHDNWIWGMQGYNNSQPQYNGKSTERFRMGFFRFKLDQNDPPNVTDVEFIRSTNNNTWGLGFSEEGIVFGSTANHNPSVYMPIANRYYERVRGWGPRQLGTIADTHLFQPITDKVRQVDQHGGYTAGAGHALYTARAYPESYWNQTAFVCGPTGHLVGIFTLHPVGADFRSTSPANLVASIDEWAAPIAAEVGPDGHVWILDWYNFIVQHNPTPQGFKTGRGNAYQTDLRDKRHGRIYRVVNESADDRTTAWKSLAGATNRELVDTLSHSNMLWRLHAQRLLVERQAVDMADHLIALIREEKLDEIGLDVGAIHALWTLHGIGMIDSPGHPGFSAATAALKHRSAGVRRNACRVLPADPQSTAALLQSKVLNDENAQVRLAAILRLADMPYSEDAGKAIARLATDPATMQDAWLPDAITSAGAVHAPSFLRALAGQGNEIPSRTAAVVVIVAEHLARGKMSSEELEQILAAASSAPADVADSIVLGLQKGWPSDHSIALTDTADELFEPLLKKTSTKSKSQLIQLARHLKSRSIEDIAKALETGYLAVLQNEEIDDRSRGITARQLIELTPNDEDIASTVLQQIGPRTSPELAKTLMDAVAQSRSQRIGPALLECAKRSTPKIRELAIAQLLARSETTKDLIKGIQEGAIEISDLSLDQRQALLNHPSNAIRDHAREVLERGGAIPSSDRQKVIEQLASVTQVKGNVETGHAVFKKHCSKCHKIRGEGENIGPDLTGMSVHPKEELLVHILDPSRSVEGNFRSYTVVTEDGLVFSGMLAGETKTTVELIDTEAKRRTLQRSEIDELISSKKSVMPEGFEKQLTRDDFIHLLEFLTDKGPFVPLPLDKVATACSVKGLFHPGDTGPDRLVFSDWSPKTFRGIPFVLTDPQSGSRPNIILLHGPQGTLPPKMPRSVDLFCNAKVKSFHFLSGISGWGYPAFSGKTPSMIVRLHYADGSIEEKKLLNGVHFADYIRRIDVPESTFAFDLGGRQLRYLSVTPDRNEQIERLELIKGDDPTAPIVMAVTIETR